MRFIDWLRNGQSDAAQYIINTSVKVFVVNTTISESRTE